MFLCNTQGLIETFAQTSVPLELLTDRVCGVVFLFIFYFLFFLLLFLLTGKLFRDPTKLVNINHLKTTIHNVTGLYHTMYHGAMERLEWHNKTGSYKARA